MWRKTTPKQISLFDTALLMTKTESFNSKWNKNNKKEGNRDIANLTLPPLNTNKDKYLFLLGELSGNLIYRLRDKLQHKIQVDLVLNTTSINVGCFQIFKLLYNTCQIRKHFQVLFSQMRKKCYSYAFKCHVYIDYRCFFKVSSINFK